MKSFYQAWFTEQHRVTYWDSIYDEQDFYGELFRQRMKTSLVWLDEMNLPNNSRILDVGCGAGRPARELAKRDYNVFGLDYSYGMLQKAYSLLNSDSHQFVSLSQGDIEALPYKSSSFDAVICLGVIAYLYTEYRAICELNRVLKPDGILILSFINKARVVRLLDFPLRFKNISRKVLNNTIASRKKDAHSTIPTLKTYFIPQVQKSIQVSGFTVDAYETVPLELLTFYDQDMYPRKMAEKVTMFFEKFYHVPFIESFGGMCVMKAIKNYGC